MSAQKPGRRRWKRWVVSGIVAVAAVLVGVPFLYIHLVEGAAPAPLS